MKRARSTLEQLLKSNGPYSCGGEPVMRISTNLLALGCQSGQGDIGDADQSAKQVHRVEVAAYLASLDGTLRADGTGMQSNRPALFRGRHFAEEIIVLCVR
jgi:hypothetical protein